MTVLKDHPGAFLDSLLDETHCDRTLTLAKRQWAQLAASKTLYNEDNYIYMNSHLYNDHIHIYFKRSLLQQKVTWLSLLVHWAQDLAAKVIRVWVQISVMTLVFLSNTLYYNCFSSPRSKWVPVSAEMVLVIVLAWCAKLLGAQVVYYQGSCDGKE